LGPSQNDAPFLFLTHRFSCFDKAIDLIDEAAAKLKMEISTKPEALDEVDRKVVAAAYAMLLSHNIDVRSFHSGIL